MRLYDFRRADFCHEFEALVDEGEEIDCPACASSRVAHQVAAFSIGSSRSDSGAAASGSRDGGDCFGGGCAGGACGF